MNRTWGVRLSMTAAASALSLAFMTGCSSDSGESKKDTAADAKATPTAAAAPAAKAVTAAELEKLLLAAGDVKGYKVSPGDDTLPKGKSEVKTDKAECAPLAWANTALPPGDTTAAASNTISSDKPTDAATKLDVSALLSLDMTWVGLSSYDGDGATKAMKTVSDAITTCASGFSLSGGPDNTSKITKVASEKGTGGGDEALAFSENVSMDGAGTAVFHTEVIRKGNTVATFYTLDFGAFETGQMPKVPAAIITAQLAKLK
ncbi:hypothetical protein ACSCBZ_02530 [Streptomyces niveiscabiei]|uniref:Lipoprotein n=1 Tax=Streptomyces niveiscabiei TaxID=164115 RepID=A0ABW9I6G8_9ACTN|nr:MULTISPECIES: hypothetical protein [Streptomyces]